MKKNDGVFRKRLEKYEDELRWLYMELYGNGEMFAELIGQMYEYYKARKVSLKNRDKKREEDPEWFKRNDMLGMMLYIDNFAGTLKGVEEKLDYLKSCKEYRRQRQMCIRDRTADMQWQTFGK